MKKRVCFPFFNFFFAIDRVKLLADQHPEWKTQEPFRAVLEGDADALAAAAVRSAMVESPGYVESVEPLEYGYKELEIAAGPDGAVYGGVVSAVPELTATACRSSHSTRSMPRSAVAWDSPSVPNCATWRVTTRS